MKSIRFVAVVLALMAGSAIAAENPTDQERLVGLELALIQVKATGLGERHPTVVKLEADIRKIENENPTVRDKAYLALLKSNRTRLEEEQTSGASKELGDNHPKRVAIALQIAGIQQKLEAAD